MDTIDRENIDGLAAAQYFKYMLQFKYSYITNKVDLRRIQAKSFYKKYRKEFDRLVVIFQKYQLDAIEYIKFFVTEYKKMAYDIPSQLLNMRSIVAFIDNKKIKIKHRKIFKWVKRTSETISEDCIANGIPTTKDYLRKIIDQRKLAQYFFTGKLSKYWLAGIPSFRKIIQKLDSMSREEFQDLYQKFEIYNTEVNEAFLQEKNQKVNPIKMTDDLILQKRTAIFNQSK